MEISMPLHAAAETWACLSIADQHRIAVFALDSSTGRLKYHSDVKLTGTPGSLCTDPRRKFLFAAVRSTESVAAFRIHHDSGSLAHVETRPVGLNLTYLSTDDSGKFLFGASYSGGKISVHRLAENGTVSEHAVQMIPTAINAHSIVLDPSNRFVFVPHTGPNAIFQFSLDRESGNLSPQTQPRIEAPSNSGPRHLKFHSTLPFAYVADEQGSSASVYRLSDSGTLEHVQTLSTLPSGFKGENTCAEVQVHPEGNFLYVSNRGHDSLACYAIHPQTGLLTPLGNVSTEKTPRSFSITPDGRFLAAAGQDSGRIALYSIPLQTGLPEQIETLDVGGNLAWISFVTSD
jgi:6-phosphogluconolactonase